MKNVFTYYTSFGVSISPSCADSQGFLKIREDLMAYVEKNGLSDLTESELWAYDMSKSIAKWRDEYENCVFKSCSFIDESKKSRFPFSLFTRNKKNITHFNYCGACQSKVEVFKDSSSINTCSQQ